MSTATAVRSPAAVVRQLVWPHLDYTPNRGQTLLHAATERHRVAAFGRRAGKSTAGGRELIPEALASYTRAAMLLDLGLRDEFWIVGPNYDDSEKEFRVFYESCKKLELPFDRPGTYSDPRGGNMVVSLWGGRFIVTAKSAAHPDSLDGEGLRGALLVEAAKMKQRIFVKYIRAALADRRGWSLHTSTPEGKNHFYDLWQRGQSQDPTWWSMRAPSWVNEIVFPGGEHDEEIEALRSDLSEPEFNQEIAALFTDFVGRVFSDFDEEVHVADVNYNPELPLYLAVDYGWTNPFVALAIQVDVWDRVWVLGEYRTQHKDIGEIAKELSDLPLLRRVATIYPDPADPGASNILSKALSARIAGDTGGELKWRLELIRRHLKLRPVEKHDPAEWKPAIFIDRGCRGLIREMQDYRYPDNKSEVRPNLEEPLPVDDHGPEALGRFFRGYFGPPSKTDGGKAKVTTARFGQTRRR